MKKLAFILLVFICDSSFAQDLYLVTSDHFVYRVSTNIQSVGTIKVYDGDNSKSLPLAQVVYIDLLNSNVKLNNGFVGRCDKSPLNLNNPLNVTCRMRTTTTSFGETKETEANVNVMTINLENVIYLVFNLNSFASQFGIWLREIYNCTGERCCMDLSPDGGQLKGWSYSWSKAKITGNANLE